MKQQKINEIKNYLRNNNKNNNDNIPNRKYKDYVLVPKENGHEELLRSEKKVFTTNDGQTISSTVLHKVINDVEFSNKWDEMHKGHIGRDATYQKFKSMYYCTGMWVTVDNAVKQCDICQTNKIKGINKEYVAIEDTEEYSRMVFDLTSLKGEHRNNDIIIDSTDSFSSNWDTIQIDNLKESNDAKIVYILICVDSFTKFATGRCKTSFICLTSKKAVPIYNFLAITYKDKPIKKWHCDNGREFKTKSAHGAPSTPTTQGMVERVNQEIKKLIRNFQKEEYKIGKTQTISSYLELAIEVYNNRTHRAIGMSPYQAIGIKPLFQTATLDTGFQVNLDENVVCIPEISYKLRQEIILKNIEKYNNNWSSKSKKQFQIDDIVFLLEISNKKKTLIKSKIKEIHLDGQSNKKTYRIQFLEDGVNNKQKTGMIWEYYYNGSNDLNDLTSFTSNLYLSNHSKVVDLLLSFTKKIGYDLTNYNLDAIAIQDDPLQVLEDSFFKINVLKDEPNEGNPCFHTFKNEKLKAECLKLLDGNATAPILINQLRKEVGLDPIPQNVGNHALIHLPAIVQRSVTSNPSLNVANVSKQSTNLVVHPSNQLAIVAQTPLTPLTPPTSVTQTPSTPPTSPTQTPSNHPGNVIVPMLSPTKIQNNKQIIPRSPKYDTPQKPKKKLKFSRKELLANDFKILNRSIQGDLK
ncbi:hypothetical protein ACTFIY_008735 [Dictyostelium cf. discoideum]